MRYSFDDLKGRNCVITGGFGVIGTALTRGLAEAGVNLAVISRSKDNPEKGEAISKEFGIKCLGISASTLDKAELEAALEDIHAKLGKVDILINCAGGNSPKATCKVEQMTKDDDLADTFYGLDMAGFDFVFDLNFKGTLLATMVFTKDMLEAGKGNVLNISSMNSIRPLTKIPAYSAAKGAINNFTQWYAVHVKYNIYSRSFDLTTHKFGEPEDLVGTMLYLLSDISSFVTGVIIPVDGGYSAFGGV